VKSLDFTQQSLKVKDAFAVSSSLFHPTHGTGAGQNETFCYNLHPNGKGNGGK
jgi:hypothetical protein